VQDVREKHILEGGEVGVLGHVVWREYLTARQLAKGKAGACEGAPARSVRQSAVVRRTW
jgi:hypothetical protein